MSDDAQAAATAGETSTTMPPDMATGQPGTGTGADAGGQAANGADDKRDVNVMIDGEVPFEGDENASEQNPLDDTQNAGADENADGADNADDKGDGEADDKGDKDEADIAYKAADGKTYKAEQIEDALKAHSQIGHTRRSAAAANADMARMQKEHKQLGEVSAKIGQYIAAFGKNMTGELPAPGTNEFLQADKDTQTAATHMYNLAAHLNAGLSDILAEAKKQGDKMQEITGEVFNQCQRLAAIHPELAPMSSKRGFIDTMKNVDKYLQEQNVSFETRRDLLTGEPKGDMLSLFVRLAQADTKQAADGTQKLQKTNKAPTTRRMRATATGGMRQFAPPKTIAEQRAREEKALAAGLTSEEFSLFVNGGAVPDSPRLQKLR